VDERKPRLMTPKPGEVYFAADPQGESTHRLIVVSNEAFNRGHYVTIVPTTSTRFHERRKMKNCVPFNKNAFRCFTRHCVAQAEQIVTVDKAELQLSNGPIGVLSSEKMREVIAAIGYVISAKCVPQTEE